jgi:hypothetical protein
VNGPLAIASNVLDRAVETPVLNRKQIAHFTYLRTVKFGFMWLPS